MDGSFDAHIDLSHLNPGILQAEIETELGKSLKCSASSRSKAALARGHRNPLDIGGNLHSLFRRDDSLQDKRKVRIVLAPTPHES